MAINKEIFDQTVSLCMAIPWLAERGQSLNLLLNECNAEEQLSLLSDLLKRFVYLNPVDIEDCLESIVTQIVDVWKLEPANTQLVAMTFDDQADSGQWVLHFLKVPLAKRNWRPAKLTNNVQRALKYLDGRPNVVLVDEFSGTGKTAIGRIEYLRTEALKRGVQNHRLRICLLAAMDNAYENIRQKEVDCFVKYKLNRGISEAYVAVELGKARANMLLIESWLAPTFNDKALPSFGYGGAEALYSADGNIPNSVFPVFWWPQFASGAARSPMFHRLDP